MKVQSYLFFDGRCEEALEFYGSKLGAKVKDLMRFKDNPDPAGAAEGCGNGAGAPISPDKVMHASFQIGDTELLASDGMAQGQPKFQGISLALTAPNEAEARRLFDALCDGGQVQMPMAKTFFSPAFGMVADRFGVSWMVLAD
jgi:PhnB protein